MNERLSELLDRVQATAVQAGDIASDAAYGVGRKAGELLSVAKLNIQAANLKADVNLAFREVGELLYATHTGSPTDSEVLLSKLQAIDELKARIQALEEQIGREREAHTCATCGAPTREGDRFCRECGGKL